MIDDRAFYMVYIESDDCTKELPIMLPTDETMAESSKASDFVKILMDNNIRFRLEVEEGGIDWRARSDVDGKRMD